MADGAVLMLGRIEGQTVGLDRIGRMPFLFGNCLVNGMLCRDS